MTTIGAFITAVAGLSPTGVVKKYDHTPLSINTADLPAAYLRLPTANYDQARASSENYDGKQRSVDLVVCIEPLGQSNAEPNYEATVAMMDKVETAIDAAGIMPIVAYTLTAGGINIGGVDFWAITATITGDE